MGVVDPYAAGAPDYAALRDLNVPLVDLPGMFYAGHSAELAVISTPIQFHAAQTVFCLRAGSHVLCEKPAAATVQEVEEMIAARDETGRRLAIGYQWCYDPAMLSLKRDIDAGLLGKPLSLKSIVLWPRDFRYYHRGQGWAGRRFAPSGEPIFDSVASNATAHYLENMLWLCGRGFDGEDFDTMSPRVWRANDIETFDTICLAGRLKNGAEIRFAASHAVQPGEWQDPAFVYEFEKAVVSYGGIGRKSGSLTARFSDGTVRDYGDSVTGGCENKLKTAVAMARGENVSIPCPAEAAMRHTTAMSMIFRICPDAEVFPESDICRTDERVWVPGLADKLIDYYNSGTLPD